jgi:hypothetical protein
MIKFLIPYILDFLKNIQNMNFTYVFKEDFHLNILYDHKNELYHQTFKTWTLKYLRPQFKKLNLKS